MYKDNFKKGEIIIYKTSQNEVELKVKLEKETVWLSLDQMAFLFDRDKSVISRHIRNIFQEKELNRNSVVANFATTAVDGKTYQVDYYDLDLIISVGYRVKSQNGVKFRIWATKALKQYLINPKIIADKRILGNNAIPVFLADDVDAVFEKIKQYGVDIVSSPENFAFTDYPYRCFQCKDTEGNLIEIAKYERK